MILESRSIIFSEEEIVIALRPLLSAKGQDESFEPDEISPYLDEEGEVSLTYKNSAKGDLNFDNKELGVALLNHCIESDIPLPRGSFKELALRGDHIALIVRIETTSKRS